MERLLIAKELVRFSIPEEFWKRKDWVKYKTIPEWHTRVIEERLIASDPGDRFRAEVETHVNAYLFDGKAPPAAIATAVVNIADDYVNGRPLEIRAGDYIAIQTHIRG